MKRIFLGLAVAATLLAQVPPDDDIRAILTERIDHLHQGVGIVVGIVDRGGRRFVSYGSFGVDDPRPVGEDTVFGIGSVTKLFTSTVLADMVRRGEVSLNDPVAKYLPRDGTVPRRGNKQITLLDLATHRSGLPLMPSNNPAPKDPANPFAGYTPAQLFQFVSQFQLTSNIGSAYEYSNVGAALLGQALARRAGMDYGALVRVRVLNPLHLDNTAIALTPAMQEHLAPGHEDDRRPAVPWDLGAMAPAGALRSDARDLLTFLAANLGLVKSPLLAAMQSMTKVRRMAEPSNDIALAWFATHRGGRELFWHDGAVSGYQSFAGYDARAGIGVVVLGNMDVDVSDLGLYLLDPSSPPRPLRSLESEAETAGRARSATPEFSGRLERAGDGSITVRLDSGRAVDAALPQTGDLSAGAIAASYPMAAQVRMSCKWKPGAYNPAAAIHQYLELTGLELLRPPTAAELAETAAYQSWQAGENLLPQPPPEGAEGAAEAAAELERVRRVNLELIANLPNFVADETAWRYSSSLGSREWHLDDVIGSELTVKGVALTRASVHVNGLPFGRPFTELGGWRWHGFGLEIKPTFDPACPTKIEPVGSQTVNGRKMLIYRFSSLAAACFVEFGLQFGGTHRHYNPARSGRVLVDAATGAVMRYEEDAFGFPEAYGLDWRTLVEQWDYVAIGGASHLVPMSAEFVIGDSTGRVRRVAVEYRNHRHFEAATTLTFGKDR